jgi:hypothetical protein
MAASATCKPESTSRINRDLTPTKPAIQISDADRKRKILVTVTDKCTISLKNWREKGSRVLPGRSVHTGTLHQAMSAKTKVTKTKTALKQETYNLSDLKHALHCGFVELGGSVSVSGSS